MHLTIFNLFLAAIGSHILAGDALYLPSDILKDEPIASPYRTHSSHHPSKVYKYRVHEEGLDDIRKPHSESSKTKHEYSIFDGDQRSAKLTRRGLAPKLGRSKHLRRPRSTDYVHSLPGESGRKSRARRSRRQLMFYMNADGNENINVDADTRADEGDAIQFIPIDGSSSYNSDSLKYDVNVEPHIKDASSQRVPSERDEPDGDVQPTGTIDQRNAYSDGMNVLLSTFSSLNSESATESATKVSSFSNGKQEITQSSVDEDEDDSSKEDSEEYGPDGVPKEGYFYTTDKNLPEDEVADLIMQEIMRQRGLEYEYYRENMSPQDEILFINELEDVMDDIINEVIWKKKSGSYDDYNIMSFFTQLFRYRSRIRSRRVNLIRDQQRIDEEKSKNETGVEGTMEDYIINEFLRIRGAVLPMDVMRELKEMSTHLENVIYKISSIPISSHGEFERASSYLARMRHFRNNVQVRRMKWAREYPDLVRPDSDEDDRMRMFEKIDFTTQFPFLSEAIRSYAQMPATSVKKDQPIPEPRRSDSSTEYSDREDHIWLSSKEYTNSEDLSITTPEPEYHDDDIDWDD